MIIHVFNSSVVSGPETLVLPALTRLGTKAAVIFLCETRLGDSWKGPVDYAKGLGLEAHAILVSGRADLGALGRLSALLRRLSPRVVHAHDVKASFYVLAAARLQRKNPPKIVSTHHGAAARFGKIRLYEQLYVRLALPRFDSVLAVCSADVDSIANRGVPREKIRIHYNGVDRRQVLPAERARVQREIRDSWRKAEPKLPENSLLIGAVARLSPEKRHDRMIRILAILKKNAPDLPVSLLCFGIGDLADSLRVQTREQGVEDRVFWMGYSKAIGQEIAGFDLLLCLSDGEGIPINLIEAGWSGTPVFSTSVGGIPDLISSAEVGFLVDKSLSDEAIAQELERVLRSSSARQSAGRAFQERVVAGFSEKAWLDQLREIYLSLDRHALG
ncbi:MAG: glycosyltransferase [Bdellovibrionota bacterium]